MKKEAVALITVINAHSSSGAVIVIDGYKITDDLCVFTH